MAVIFLRAHVLGQVAGLREGLAARRALERVRRLMQDGGTDY